MFHILALSALLLQSTSAEASRTVSVIIVPIAADYLQSTKQMMGQQPTFNLTSPDEGVNFDTDGDGTVERVAWTERGADVAFLAIDMNDDKRITSGKELFSNQMRSRVTAAADALTEVFKDMDEPLTGAVNQGHKLYERLLLWTDRNHNGISEASELRQAKELFTGIGMGFVRLRPTSDQNGNVVWLRGWTEVRTSDMTQGRALTREDHSLRARQMFEVRLSVR